MRLVLKSLLPSRTGHYVYYGLALALGGTMSTALAATDGAASGGVDQPVKLAAQQAPAVASPASKLVVAPASSAQTSSSQNGNVQPAAGQEVHAPSAAVSAPQPVAAQKASHASHQASNRLVIPLPADETIGRQDVDYTCQIDEKKAGDEVRSLRTSLPAGQFTATYLSADIMALVVLPLDGRVMVFANVVAGDGAKYVGDRYSWWAKGDDVTFAREDKNGVSIACHVVPPATAQAQPHIQPQSQQPSQSGQNKAK